MAVDTMLVSARLPLPIEMGTHVLRRIKAKVTLPMTPVLGAHHGDDDEEDDDNDGSGDGKVTA